MGTTTDRLYKINVSPEEVQKIPNLLMKLGNKVYLSLTNGKSDSYNIQELINRHHDIMDLCKVKPRYIELKYPYDTSLLEKIPEGTTPIICFEDLEGTAKIDFHMIIKLAKKYPNAVFKILASPETIIELNLLIRWGKQLTENEIKHVILCNGRFESLTPYLYEKFGNLFLELKETPYHDKKLDPRIHSTLERIIQQFQEENSFSKHEIPFVQQLVQQTAPLTPKIAILGKENLAFIEKDIFDLLNKYSRRVTGSVYLPVKSVEETNIFITGIGKQLFNGFSFVGLETKKIEGIDQYDLSSARTGVTSFLLKRETELVSFDTYEIIMQSIFNEIKDMEIVNIYIEGIHPMLFSILPTIYNQANMIKIRNRTKTKIEKVKNYFSKVEPVASKEQFSYDIIINFVPFGTKGLPNMLPFPKKLLENARLVIDTTVSPVQTPIEKAIKKYNAVYYNGLDILARKAYVEEQLINTNIFSE